MSFRDECKRELGIGCKGRSKHKKGGQPRQPHYVGEKVVNKIKGAYSGVRNGVNSVRTGFKNAKQLFKDGKELIGEAKRGISEGKKFYADNATSIKEKAQDALGSAKKLIKRKKGGSIPRQKHSVGEDIARALGPTTMGIFGVKPKRNKKFSGQEVVTGAKNAFHKAKDATEYGVKKGIRESGKMLKTAKEYAEPIAKKAASESGKVLKKGASMVHEGVNKGLDAGRNALKGKKILGHQFKKGGRTGREKHFVGALAGPAMTLAKMAAPAVVGWATGKVLNRISKKKEKSTPMNTRSENFRGGKIKEVRLATKLENPERKKHGGRTCHSMGGVGKVRKGEY